MTSAPASTAPISAPSPPRPRRPRRPRDDGETFGQFVPRQNPAAVYAYAVAVAGITPVLGAVLGPVAVVLGAFGWVHYKRRPEVEGINFAVGGIVLGTLDAILNLAGLWCIARGVGWLGG
jgi:hypothetical protein